MSKITTNFVPLVVFIVPYRNRPQHKFFFSNYLTSILKSSNLDKKYEIYFSHQCDARSFNRGGTKNIGFLAVKEKYPDDYQNITWGGVNLGRRFHLRQSWYGYSKMRDLHRPGDHSRAYVSPGMEVGKYAMVRGQLFRNVRDRNPK